MPEGEILYINSVGGFRSRKVKLDPTHPIIVTNHKDKQAHALDEKPVHSLLKPIWFTSMADMLAADSPTDPVFVGKWGIVCADNAVWPLSPQSVDEYLPIPRDAGGIAAGDANEDAEDLQHLDRNSLDDFRALKYQEYVEEATQRAMHNAEKSDNRDGYLSVVNFTLGMVACVVLLIIAAVIAYYKWGPSSDPAPVPPIEPTTALFMLAPMLGLVRLGLKLRQHNAQIGESPRSKDSRRKPKPLKPTKPRKVKRPKLDKDDAWITATVFDHPLLGGKIWHASLPYSEWMIHVPESCVFRPDIPRQRKLGAGLGAAIVAAILMGVGYQIGGAVIGLLLMFLGAIVGAGLGWVVGPVLFGNKPRIMVARIPDDNSTRRIVPIEHNYCRTVSTGDYLTNLEMVLARLNDPEADEDDIYEPTVFRATTLYDDIAAKDEQAEVSSPHTGLQKIQIGVMALMAFGSVGILFFVALATT